MSTGSIVWVVVGGLIAALAVFGLGMWIVTQLP